MTSLLRAKEVQHELGMSAAQIHNVEEVIDDVDLPLWCLRDLPLQERNEAAGLLIQQLRENLASILSSRQMERLNQLSRQAEGIAAVLEPEVAVRLDLSDEQIDNISHYCPVISRITSIGYRNRRHQLCSQLP